MGRSIAATAATRPHPLQAFSRWLGDGHSQSPSLNGADITQRPAMKQTGQGAPARLRRLRAERPEPRRGGLPCRERLERLGGIQHEVGADDPAHEYQRAAATIRRGRRGACSHAEIESVSHQYSISSPSFVSYEPLYSAPALETVSSSSWRSVTTVVAIGGAAIWGGSEGQVVSRGRRKYSVVEEWAHARRRRRGREDQMSAPPYALWRASSLRSAKDEAAQSAFLAESACVEMGERA